jgi:hypothetical protein
VAKIPWICCISGKPDRSNALDARDFESLEDALGSVVDIQPGGLVVNETTKVTDVRQETTDDN